MRKIENDIYKVAAIEVDLGFLLSAIEDAEPGSDRRADLEQEAEDLAGQLREVTSKMSKGARDEIQNDG